MRLSFMRGNGWGRKYHCSFGCFYHCRYYISYFRKEMRYWEGGSVKIEQGGVGWLFMGGMGAIVAYVRE